MVLGKTENGNDILTIFREMLKTETISKTIYSQMSRNDDSRANPIHRHTPSGATNRKLPIVYVIMLIKYFQQFLKLFSELEYKCPIEICEGGRPRGRLRPTEICVARPSSIG